MFKQVPPDDRSMKLHLNESRHSSDGTTTCRFVFVLRTFTGALVAVGCLPIAMSNIRAELQGPRKQ